MLQCFPSSFRSIQLTVWEKMSFEEFQYGCHGGHLGYQNGTILAFTISMSLRCLPSSFGSIGPMVWEDMSFEEFQDGRHGSLLAYRNGRILVILNLCIAPMPPIKFQLNQTYGLGGDVVWRISRWLPRQPSWISERNDFSNSESLCHCDASHQDSAQSDLLFGRIYCLKNFKMATMAAILDIRMEQF